MDRTHYEVTIGYKGIFSVQVKAETEEEAREVAVDRFKKERDRWCKAKDLALESDHFSDEGVLNMDETWNQF